MMDAKTLVIADNASLNMQNWHKEALHKKALFKEAEPKEAELKENWFKEGKRNL